jgi:CheY-like chemotaxis protein
MMPRPAEGFRFRILVVDDDETICATSAQVLASQGYEVHTAANGFEGLVALQQALPDLIISDLKMPGMSGFEFLSVVRRRFPQIPVISISGEYNGSRPVGLLADAYLQKANYSREELFTKIAELIRESPLRPHVGKPSYAPVWFPRSATGYYILTCTDCLRSFSVPEMQSPTDEVRESACIFCGTNVRYIVERS